MASVAARYDSPLAAVALAAVLVALLLGVRVGTAGGPSGAVVAGDGFVGAGRPADLRVVARGSNGYDGQFVYRLALDPFTHARTDRGITLDNPSYRQQRIGLPVVAWAVNRTTLLPLSVTLLLVNALAVLAAAWAAAVLARRLARNALWGVLVGLSPALVVALCRDLTEPLATALLLAGLVAWTGRRTPLAVLVAIAAFTAAALTRETMLAPLFGLGLYESYAALRGRDPLRALSRGAALLVPVAVVAAWQLHLEDVWGRLPLRATEGDVGLPVVHALRTMLAGGGPWSDWHTRDALLGHAWVAERLVLLAVLAVTAYALRGHAHPAIRTAWVVSALLALSATWTRDVAFLRAANEAVVLGTFVLLGSSTRAARAGLAGTAGLSLAAAGMYGVLL